MKTVQIPYDLFIDLAMYHLRGEDDYEEEIHQGLEQKLDAMLNRQLYSRYKTAPTKEEREQARQEYLDRRGVPQSLRWMWAEDYAQRTPANKLLTTPVFAVCIHTASRKTGRGFRRSRIPPRRAHDTLQPQDESIIVGYYTSAEVPPRKLPVLHNLKSGGKLPMARGDGIHRTNARNMRLTAAKIGNAQQHNEREKESYVNQDIVPERTRLNVHFKKPTTGYAEMFEQMKKDGIISTRGLKEDAFLYGELVFDVNTAYFHNHGGYDFAKQFYTDAYKSAIEIVGGEQYILSAVMHADERNRAMSDALGQDVYHYHLHVVYIPVVEKQILWSKRCKDKSLVGTVKETIQQVSMSKKWDSKPALDEHGKPLLNANGKTVLRKSYSVLQDDFFAAMQKAGYDDVERGERGSSEEHLTVTQFKVQQEQARLAELTEQNRQQEQQAATLGRQIEKIQNQQVNVAAIEKIEAKSVPFSSKVAVEREDFERLSTLAKKYITAEKKESKLQKALDAANRLIARLKEEIAGLKQELSEYKSVRSKLRTSDLERENAELRGKVQHYEDVIQRNNLWHFFRPRREKTAMRDDAR